MKSTEIDAADRSDALPNGTVIDGRYTITGVIACGGMGVVHRARHEKLEIDVAVKTVRRLLMLLPEVSERFVDEARGMARLRSPHVVRVFDYGRLPDDRPYMVMELLEGEDAADRLERSGPSSNEATQATLLQVCDALAEIHSAAMIHRDLKPGNLFHARDGAGKEIVKVLDFGIARTRARGKALTVVGAGLGSPHYMAPEQIEGSAEIDHRADIWTLGIVCYELLSGQPPFGGQGISEICARVMRQQRKPLGELRKDVWPGLVGFIDRCLQIRPADRFPDILSARAALRRAKHMIPSVIVSEEPERRPLRDSDPATKAHVLDTLNETKPEIPGLAPRRWPKVLAVAALAAAAWIAWSRPEQAMALTDDAVRALSPNVMERGPVPHVVRSQGTAMAALGAIHRAAEHEKGIPEPDAGGIRDASKPARDASVMLPLGPRMDGDAGMLEE